MIARFWPDFSLRPLTRRRLANFRANRRGYWAFRIFLVVLFLSIFAEFIANDRPIYLSYQDRSYFPVFVDYPEEVFGGFLAYTDYTDPFIQEEISAHGYMIWPVVPFSYDTHDRALDVPAPALLRAGIFLAQMINNAMFSPVCYTGCEFPSCLA